MTPRAPAIVLLSGGMDSATALAIAVHDGFQCHALSFRYGQRHEVELAAAAEIAKHLGATQHVVLNLDMTAIGDSALTADIPVPKARTADEIGHGVPVTYVPARNTVFLAYALGLAEVVEAADIFIGVNALDYSGYPDCRPEFIASFEHTANLATKLGTEGTKIRIRTPLMSMTKAEIIRTGLDLGVDFSLTRTCYDPDVEGRACGACDACLLRLKGFAENGLTDPAPYQAG